MRYDKKNRQPGKSALIIALLLLIGGGLSGLFIWERAERKREAASVQDPYAGAVTIFYNGETYRLRDDLDSYLFMGLDQTTESRSDPLYAINNQQADFLLLVVVDHSAQSYYGVHINRDTMAEITKLDLTGARIESYRAQICLAHTYGTGGKDSCRNQVRAVSRYFYDLPIKHYISMTMDGIPVLNDAVGGVTVHVSDDFSAVDSSLVMGEDVRLRGEQALTYVRARNGMPDKTNLNRMARQREYMYGLVSRISDSVAAEEGFSLRLADSVADYVISDLTTTDMAALSESVKEYRFAGVYSIEGDTVVNENDNVEFHTDEDAFRAMVVKLFFQHTKY